MPTSEPTRNLALELARVTEAAALAAGRFMGRGDKEAADGAAVNAMRLVLQTVDINGIIVIGEGEKDNAPMLYNGENVGNGSPPDVDVAVDPIDGTRPLAFGRTNSLATVAIAPTRHHVQPGPVCLHEQAGGRTGSQGQDQHREVHHRESQGDCQGQEQGRRGPDDHHPRPAAAR